jgi:hypothetical protein
LKAAKFLLNNLKVNQKQKKKYEIVLQSEGTGHEQVGRLSYNSIY